MRERAVPVLFMVVSPCCGVSLPPFLRGAFFGGLDAVLSSLERLSWTFSR